MAHIDQNKQLPVGKLVLLDKKKQLRSISEGSMSMSGRGQQAYLGQVEAASRKCSHEFLITDEIGQFHPLSHDLLSFGFVTIGSLRHDLA